MNFNELYPDTCTSVSIAAHAGNVDTLKTLLREGKHTNCEDNRGWRALHHAVSNGHLKCVRILLEASDVDVNATSFGRETALLLLCNSQIESETQFSIASLLLEKGAFPNSQSKDQYCSILNAAVSNCTIPLIKLLLDYGADVSAIDFEYGSSLDAAALRREVDILDVLLEQNPSFSKEDQSSCLFFHKILCQPGDNIPFLRRLLQNSECVSLINNVCRDTGNTPLLVACTNGMLEAVPLLMDYGADSNIRDYCGILPLNRYIEHIDNDTVLTEDSTFMRLYQSTAKQELRTVSSTIASSFLHNVARCELKNVLSFAFQNLGRDFFSDLAPVALKFDLSDNSYCLVTPLGVWCAFCTEMDLEMIDLLISIGKPQTPEKVIPPILMPLMAKVTIIDEEICRTKVIYRLMELGEDVLTNHRSDEVEESLRLPKIPIASIFLYALHPRCFKELCFLMERCVAASAVFHREFFTILRGEIQWFRNFLNCDTSRELAEHVCKVLRLINNFVPKLPSSAVEFYEDALEQAGEAIYANEHHLSSFTEAPRRLVDYAKFEIRTRLWNANPRRPLWRSIEALAKEFAFTGPSLDILYMKSVTIH